MIFLTAEDVLLIHSLVVDETGGSHGIRNREVIAGIVGTPQQAVFGKELYPTIFEKAAVLAREIIMQHPFLDGNKRTGMTSAAILLQRNGWALAVKEGGIETMALRIIIEHLEVKEIARWLKANTGKHTVDEE